MGLKIKRKKAIPIDYSLGEDQILNFGKYEGSTLDHVMAFHAGYAEWMIEKGILYNVPDEVVDAIMQDAGDDDLQYECRIPEQW